MPAPAPPSPALVPARALADALPEQDMGLALRPACIDPCAAAMFSKADSPRTTGTTIGVRSLELLPPLLLLLLLPPLLPLAGCPMGAGLDDPIGPASSGDVGGAGDGGEGGSDGGAGADGLGGCGGGGSGLGGGDILHGRSGSAGEHGGRPRTAPSGVVGGRVSSR